MSEGLEKNIEMTTDEESMIVNLKLREIVEREANRYYRLATEARTSRWYTEEPVNFRYIIIFTKF
jgi:hypothetical protein